MDLSPPKVGGIREDPFTGKPLQGRKKTVALPLPGQQKLTGFFTPPPAAKKPRSDEVEVEMTTFSSTITTTATTSGSPPASTISALPVTSSRSSSSSSSKRHRSTNGGDGDGGAESDSGHNKNLLPPSKEATEILGIAACDDMVEHLVEALKQKLEVPLATAVETVVARATEQLKTNVGRVFDQTQQEAEAEVARLKEVEAELHRRAGARTQDALLLDDCVCQLCTGKVACVICSSNAAALIHETMKKSLFLMSNGGIQLDGRATARFREHKGSAMHLLCVQAQSDAAADSIPAAITRERERAAAVMTRLMRLCCNLAKEKRSFRSFERDIFLLHESGVDMGETDHSRGTCRSMLMLIADVGRIRRGEERRREEGERDKRKRGKREAKKRGDLGLLFPFLSRAKFIF